MNFSRIHRLTNAVDAVRGKGHDTRDLLDFELLARPAQAFGHHADWRHYGTARTTGNHAARAASPTALAAAPIAPRTTARSARGALALGGAVDLGLDQSLRIVAVRFVELPASAKIHAGGRRLLKLFARTR